MTDLITSACYQGNHDRCGGTVHYDTPRRSDLTAPCRCRHHRRDKAVQRRYEMYAAKWFADGNHGHPSDEALRMTFANCVRPAKPDEYPAIRDAIAECYAPGR